MDRRSVVTVFSGRTPDRCVTGFGGANHAIYSPVGIPRSRDELEPFTYELYPTTDPRSVKAQEKFVKGLTKLNRPKRGGRS